MSQPQVNQGPAALARNSLLAYASAVDPSYKAGKPHALMAAGLEAVARGEITRLIIEAPPRHGKSREVSELFPAWWKGLFPKLGIVHATYAQDLADDFGRKVRNLMGTKEHLAVFPDSKIDPASDSIRRFHTLQGGAYYAAGVGGPIAGRGGHLLLLDDPYKNRQEADSPIVRAGVENWYRSVFRTRLHNINKAGAIVIVLTHWHDQDLAGMLEKEAKSGGEQWVIIRLRARAEGDDVLGRKVGEPLWPEGGFTDQYLTDMEMAVGPREWAALFQQRPSAADGNIFQRDWWMEWCPTGDEGWGLPECLLAQEPNGDRHEHTRLPSSGGRQYQSWDTAVKGKQTSDFVVGLHGYRFGADLYITDREKGRWGLPETTDAMRRMTHRHPGPYAKWVEARANGPACVQTLQREIPGMIDVEPQELGTDKPARYNACAPSVRSGNVWLPRTASWKREFIECLASVPATDYDDDADAFSQMCIKALGGGSRGVIRLLASMVEDKRRREEEQKQVAS